MVIDSSSSGKGHCAGGEHVISQQWYVSAVGEIRFHIGEGIAQ